MNYLVFDGKNSADYNVFISGEATYNTPEKDIELISIPGKNGTLSIDKKRYANININYPAFIAHDFRANFDAFKALLMSSSGYSKLSDTYDPDHYRLARYHAAIEPSMDQLNRHGTFNITFDCDPRRFLKSGDKVAEFTASGTLKNPTLFEALPLIRVYGTGYFECNNVYVQITSANEYTDIDCELQEAYKGSTNCNGNIVLVDGVFPSLKSGINSITKGSGMTSIKIYPRWWTI